MVRPRFFYGWYIVLCGFLSQGMRVGLGAQTFGFFFKPMSEELGWSRAMLTGGLMTRSLIGVSLSPLVGFAVDRYDPRYLMVGSTVMMGLSIMLLSQTHSLWQFVLFFGVIGAFGVPGLGYGVLSPTIAKWFIRKRGRATAIATAGLNAGAVAMTPVTLLLIEGQGWCEAWFWLALIPWVVVIPPALIWLRRQPEDMGLLPDGDDPKPTPQGEQEGSDRQSDAGEVSWSVREAFRTPAIWLIIGSQVLSSAAMGSIIVHRIPYITDQGYSSAIAGTTMVVFSVAAFLSKLLWGFLADRFHVRWLMTLMLLCSAIGLWFLIDAPSVWHLYVGFGLGYGLTGGGLTVMGPLVWAKYFGRRHLGAIQGVTAPVYLVGDILGPMFAAFVYDRSGSYDLAFMFFVGFLVLGAILIWVTRPPVHPTRHEVG